MKRRPMLYFLAGFCPAWIASAERLAGAGSISLLQWSMLLFAAIGGGVVTLRAYYDGTSTRTKKP